MNISENNNNNSSEQKNAIVAGSYSTKGSLNMMDKSTQNSRVQQILNSMPQYTSSQIWQELLIQKAETQQQQNMITHEDSVNSDA